MITAVHGVYIDKKKVLMVTTKEGYDIFPGGKKKDYCEPDESCLKRESSEELGDVKFLVGCFYKKFVGPLSDDSDYLRSRTYFMCPAENQKLEKVSGEIIAKKFVSVSDYNYLNLTPVSKKTLDSLIRDKLLN